MRIDRDVALRRLLHHVQVVTRHPLPVVPFAQRVAARGVATFHLAVVADIAGLDRVHAEARIQVHRLGDLIFVMVHCAPGFMMADQMHALGGGVPG